MVVALLCGDFVATEQRKKSVEGLRPSTPPSRK